MSVTIHPRTTKKQVCSSSAHPRGGRQCTLARRGLQRKICARADGQHPIQNGKHQYWCAVNPDSHWTTAIAGSSLNGYMPNVAIRTVPPPTNDPSRHCRCSSVVLPCGASYLCARLALMHEKADAALMLTRDFWRCAAGGAIAGLWRRRRER